jgi:TetR/AcrR family transcriptional regulator, cholesterol catabolism regulator
VTESPVRAPRRATNRLQPLLDAAARQFAERGFHGTTTRDITATASMTPGSLYSHFSSKDELLLAVYAEGVRRVLASMDAAVSIPRGPWDRLEVTVIAHLEAILDQSDYARVMVRVLPQDVASVAGELRELRNQVEARYRTLIASLGLPTNADRKFLRLLLLGAMNWSPVWFRSDKDHPKQIAKNFLRLLQAGVHRG